jgi:hypothetical protein
MYQFLPLVRVECPFDELDHAMLNDQSGRSVRTVEGGCEPAVAQKWHRRESPVEKNEYRVTSSKTKKREPINIRHFPSSKAISQVDVEYHRWLNIGCKILKSGGHAKSP